LLTTCLWSHRSYFPYIKATKLENLRSLVFSVFFRSPFFKTNRTAKLPGLVPRP
jgi:hypothetical protein